MSLQIPATLDNRIALSTSFLFGKCLIPSFNGVCVAGCWGKLFTVPAIRPAANKFKPFRGCSSRRRRDGRFRIWFANFTGHGLQKRCTVMHCEKYLFVCVCVVQWEYAILLSEKRCTLVSAAAWQICQLPPAICRFRHCQENP